MLDYANLKFVPFDDDVKIGEKIDVESFIKIEDGISLDQLKEIKAAFQVIFIKIGLLVSGVQDSRDKASQRTARSSRIWTRDAPSSMCGSKEPSKFSWLAKQTAGSDRLAVRRLDQVRDKPYESLR